MALFCAISGEVPSKPVVSKLSGHLFEQHLIEKARRNPRARRARSRPFRTALALTPALSLAPQHLDASGGTCPITGQPLTTEDLMPVQCNLGVRPRPPNATSLPGLLATFQNEWDSLMLETHTLKSHLDDTRKELAQALYQHDAACRVIARVMKQRDEARSQATTAPPLRGFGS